MKPKICILSVFLLINNFLYSQWNSLNSGVTSNLNSTYFLSENIGFAVGDSSTVLKTTDGGVNWDQLEFGSDKIFNSIRFNNNIGVIVGNQGIIYLSEDYGENWNQVFSNNNYDLYSVAFADSGTWYSVGKKTNGSGAVVLKTTNSGIDWVVIQSSYDSLYSYNLLSVFFVNQDTGFAGGNGVAMSTIIKTVDGGHSWNLIYGGLPFFIRSVFFIDKNTGYAVGDGSNILKTVDGGNNWSIYDDESSENKKDIFFISNEVGYIIIGNAYPNNPESYKILKTVDGGISWQTIYSGTGTSLKQCYFFNLQIGYVVGGNGTILKTTNGGNTLINEYKNSFDNFIIYPNPSNGKINIKTNEQIIKITVFDMSEKIIFESKITEIDLTNLNIGTYLLKIETNNGLILTKKIIIK